MGICERIIFFQGLADLRANQVLQIRNLTAMFTSLTTLSLASNNLTNITLPLSTSLLTKIELSSNAITTLEHIRPLTALPILQTLSLRANPLTSLSTPPDELVVFPKLKHLDLKSTLLPTLSSLNPISLSFPELQSLLTNHTPLTTYPSASLHTIARLATLTELNYSQITSPERQNAELYYLNQISKQLAAAVDNTEEHEILKENPRWNELCDIHGSPTTISPRPTETAGAGTLAARVTAFTFHISTQDLQTARKHAQGITGHSINETVEKEDDLETPIEIERNNIPFNHHAPPSIEKKKLIPRTVDVYRLKGIVGHLFAIRPLSIKLVWETDEWDPVGEGDGGWSVSEDDESVDEDDESDNEDDGSNDDDNDGSNDDDNDEKKSIANTEGKKNTEKKMGLWKRRELELVDGTREVGFFVEGKEARVRVEAR